MSIDIITLITSPEKEKKEKKENKKLDLGDFLTREISLNSPLRRNKIRFNIFNELGLLLESGIDLKSALDIMETGAKLKREKKTIRNLLVRIKDGSTLSQAMEKDPIFSPYEYYSVSIGEESGRLPEVTATLTEYYNNKISQGRKIRSALSYPILVILTTIATMGFMVKGIIPMFENVYARFEGDLPALTKSILKLSDKSSHYMIIALIISALLLIFVFRFKTNDQFRKYGSLFVLSIPILKNLILLTYKSRFCQTFNLLISSKVNLTNSIDLIEKMIAFYPLKTALLKMKDEIAAGSTLAESMRNHKIFDKRMIALTKIAEEVNQLEMVYSQLYKQYSADLEVNIKTLNTLLEPFLIIFVGLIVAFMLISMYLPIFQIGMGIG
ncbi:MAG: type II secretion system F family protein [Bacteroidota bacterium]